MLVKVTLFLRRGYNRFHSKSIPVWQNESVMLVQKKMEGFTSICWTMLRPFINSAYAAAALSLRLGSSIFSLDFICHATAAK
jgi:hypothetical protein